MHTMSGTDRNTIARAYEELENVIKQYGVRTVIRNLLEMVQADMQESEENKMAEIVGAMEDIRYICKKLAPSAHILAINDFENDRHGLKVHFGTKCIDIVYPYSKQNEPLLLQ